MAVPRFVSTQIRLSLIMGQSGGILEGNGVGGVEHVELDQSLRDYVKKNCGGAVYVANEPYPGYKKVTLTRTPAKCRFVNAYRNIKVCAGYIERLFRISEKTDKITLYFRPDNS